MEVFYFPAYCSRLLDSQQIKRRWRCLFTEEQRQVDARLKIISNRERNKNKGINKENKES
jgi:hypothetical protein